MYEKYPILGNPKNSCRSMSFILEDYEFIENQYAK